MSSPGKPSKPGMTAQVVEHFPELDTLFFEFKGEGPSAKQQAAAVKKKVKDVKEDLTLYFGINTWYRVYGQFAARLATLAHTPDKILSIASMLKEDAKKGLPAFRPGSKEEATYGDPTHAECGFPFAGPPDTDRPPDDPLRRPGCMNRAHWFPGVCKKLPMLQTAAKAARAAALADEKDFALLVKAEAAEKAAAQCSLKCTCMPPFEFHAIGTAVCNCEKINDKDPGEKYTGHAKQGEHSYVCKIKNRDICQLEEHALKRLNERLERDLKLAPAIAAAKFSGKLHGSH
jgi:hypothetical protein